jgi:hypothetical protein
VISFQSILGRSVGSSRSWAWSTVKVSADRTTRHSLRPLAPPSRFGARQGITPDSSDASRGGVRINPRPRFGQLEASPNAYLQPAEAALKRAQRVGDRRAVRPWRSARATAVTGLLLGWIAGSRPEQKPKDLVAATMVSDMLQATPPQLRLGAGERRRRTGIPITVVTVGPGPSRRSSHSQTTRTRHPRSRKAAALRVSFARFTWIFSAQKSRRVFGNFPARQSWPCQKQPRTSTTRCRPARTMSGRPGRR